MSRTKSINIVTQPVLLSIPLRGRVFPVDTESSDIQLQYQSPSGSLYCGDACKWMKTLDTNTVDLVFADPPYNIKKAAWDVFESEEQYIEWSTQWIAEASRILKPTGSLYVCGFSEILADLKRPSLKYFKNCKWLVWHYKNKANLGKDWGRSHESILHLRKSKEFQLNFDDIRIPYGKHTLRYPARTQAATSNFGDGKLREAWVPNSKGAKPKDVIEMPTTCNGMSEKTPHPTQKPEPLLRKLIMAASNPGDLIVDPFSGSGTSLVVAEQLSRTWAGCDRSDEYNTWAVERIESVANKTIDEWVEFDQSVTSRREGIR